jgi:hypothetical protein
MERVVVRPGRRHGAGDRAATGLAGSEGDPRRIIDGQEVVVDAGVGTFVTDWVYGKASDGVWRALGSKIIDRGDEAGPACAVDG